MINAAIIGLGWWGQTLVESVSGVSDDIRFVAGTTRSLSDDAKAFAKEHNMELRASFDEIIADPSIDAVVLVTPNSIHSSQTIAAAEHGKHVFCEKPFAPTRELGRTRHDFALRSDYDIPQRSVSEARCMARQQG
jgi:predicted dehydrogenase